MWFVKKKILIVCIKISYIIKAILVCRLLLWGIVVSIGYIRLCWANVTPSLSKANTMPISHENDNDSELLSFYDLLSYLDTLPLPSKQHELLAAQ